MDQAALAGLLRRMDPALILHTGDVVYDSGAIQDYNRNAVRLEEELISETPIFLSPGNHDVKIDGGAPYLKNFRRG